MLAFARLKALAAATTAALGLVAAAAGLAWGYPAPAPGAALPAVAIQAAEPAGPPRVLGVVVDEAGRPVEGAEVAINAFTGDESAATTGPDGAFTLTAEDPWFGDAWILARTRDGRSLGLSRYAGRPSSKRAEEPVRVVVRPGCAIAVRAVDAAGAPIAGALAAIVGERNIIAQGETGDDGVAWLLIPSDGRVTWAVARKPGAGSNVFSFDGFESGGTKFGVPTGSLPAEVDLKLAAARTVRIKAVDEAGEPIAGVTYRMPGLAKPMQTRWAHFWGRSFDATTGADGVATFDWLPPADRAFHNFYPSSNGRFDDRWLLVKPDDPEFIVARMERTVPLRGRVLRPDGSPAADAMVRALGSGRMSEAGRDAGSAGARTTADGMFAMSLPPGEAYVVWAHSEEGDARPWHNVIAHPGRPIEDVELRLEPGSLVTGVATLGPEKRPLAGETISIKQEFGPPSAELARWGETDFDRRLGRSLYAKTDAEGRYSIRLSPGTYVTSWGRGGDDRKIDVSSGGKFHLDFHADRPPTGMGRLRGEVIDDAGASIPNATLEFVGIGPDVADVKATADHRGEFTVELRRVRTIVRAASPDGRLAVIAEIGDGAFEIDLIASPSASASGVLLDEAGAPAAGRKLVWGRRIDIDESDDPARFAFTSDVSTDAAGRFTLPALAVGQPYEIRSRSATGGGDLVVFPIRADRPGPFELGEVRLRPLHSGE